MYKFIIIISIIIILLIGIGYVYYLKSIKKVSKNINLLERRFIDTPNIYSDNYICRIVVNTHDPNNLERIKSNIVEIYKKIHIDCNFINSYNNIIFFEYKDRKTTDMIIKLSLENIDKLDIEQSVYDKLYKTFDKNSTGPSMNCIVKFLEKNKMTHTKLEQHSLAGLGRKQRMIQEATTSKTKTIPEAIAKDKFMTKIICESIGVPTPRGFVVDNTDDLLKYFRQMKKAVVTKPFDGNQGKCVTVDIQNEDDLLKGYNYAKTMSDKVIIEDFVKGNDYRVLIVGYKLAAASHRIPANVIGDGKHTIQELIDETNKDPRRGNDHESVLTKIKVDDIVKRTLKEKKMSLDTVLPKGEQVFLRQNANLSTGGTAEDKTDVIHPEIVEHAINITKQVGLDICGIDVVCEDITKSPSEQDFAFIELNSGPGLRMHVAPSVGKPREVGNNIVKNLYSYYGGEIPIVGVVGGYGKSICVDLIANIMRSRYTVGKMNSSGISIDDYIMNNKKMTVDNMLINPLIDGAVVGLSCNYIVRRGLGFNNCNVGVFLNNRNPDGNMEYHNLLYRHIDEKGCAVINCDDRYSNYLRKMIPLLKCRIIYFCYDKNSKILLKTIENNDPVIYYENSTIIYKNNDKEIEFNVRNIKERTTIEAIMGAVGCCLSLQLREENINENIKKLDKI